MSYAQENAELLRAIKGALSRRPAGGTRQTRQQLEELEAQFAQQRNGGNGGNGENRSLCRRVWNGFMYVLTCGSARSQRTRKQRKNKSKSRKQKQTRKNR
jgi:hypothetical protein